MGWDRLGTAFGVGMGETYGPAPAPMFPHRNTAGLATPTWDTFGMDGLGGCVVWVGCSMLLETGTLQELPKNWLPGGRLGEPLFRNPSPLKGLSGVHTF